MKDKYNFKLSIDESLAENNFIIQCHSREVGEVILKYLNQLNRNPNSLVLKQGDEYLIVAKSEVIFVEVHQKVLTVYTLDNKIKTFGSLASLYNNLSSLSFIQITRFSVVNVKSIKKVEPSFSGNLLAHLSNGKKVSVSRRYVPALKERLGI